MAFEFAFLCLVNTLRLSFWICQTEIKHFVGLSILLAVAKRHSQSDVVVRLVLEMLLILMSDDANESAATKTASKKKKKQNGRVEEV